MIIAYHVIVGFGGTNTTTVVSVSYTSQAEIAAGLTKTVTIPSLSPNANYTFVAVVGSEPRIAQPTLTLEPTSLRSKPTCLNFASV